MEQYGVDKYAENVGMNLELEDLDYLNREEKHKLAHQMVEESSIYAEHRKFSRWMKNGDEIFDEQFLATAQTVLIDNYHPNCSENIAKAIHTYLRDTGEKWRVGPNQGQFKLTLFDPENSKALQTPRKRDEKERFRAQAVVNYNTEVMKNTFNGDGIRVPKIKSQDVTRSEAGLLPYDIARYESCIDFDAVKETFEYSKKEDIMERAKKAADTMEELIEDGEVLFIADSDFWKDGEPDNMGYHPETDSIVVWDRGEYVEPINNKTRKQFMEEHNIESQARKIAEDAGFEELFN